jgi:hypothetical protein
MVLKVLIRNGDIEKKSSTYLLLKNGKVNNNGVTSPLLVLWTPYATL